MPTCAHLQKRKNGLYYFRAYVPTALILRFGRHEIVRSLQTANKAEADKRATIIKAKLFWIFDMARVIPPFLGDLDCRIHAAVFCFNFWTGVIPPSPMLGRSLL